MTLNARQIEFRDRVQPQRLDHIKFLSAPVGSGKTAAVINDIRDNLDQSYIFVSPTIRLAREIKGRLDVALVNHGQGENVFLIVTEDANPTSVQRRVINRIEAKQPNEHHVLIVTTETFRNILPRITDNRKAEYNVFLDEGIDPVDQVKFNTRHQDLFLEPITVNEDSSFFINPGRREILDTVANNPERLATIEREELNIPNFRKLAKLLVSDIYDVYGDVLENSIRAIAFLRPDHFLSFRSVTMIMAIFEQSLLALFWTEKYGIEFRPYETAHDLFDTHHAKGPRMRIHHLLHPGDNASRLNLERHFRTGERDTTAENGERVIDRIAQIVEDNFGNLPYCWATNTYFTNNGNVLSGNRMPVRCAGLDSFRRMDVVASLASMNPEPWVKNMITDRVEITDRNLYELWKLSFTYQTIGRCSIRDRTSERWVDVIVLSRDCAERIRQLFPGSEIVGQLGDLPHFGAMQQRRGPAREPTPYTRADNSAWHRYRQGNPNTGLTKQEWYETIRTS